LAHRHKKLRTALHPQLAVPSRKCDTQQQHGYSGDRDKAKSPIEYTLGLEAHHPGLSMYNGKSLSQLGVASVEVTLGIAVATVWI
jgi:hypothetical protein